MTEIKWKSKKDLSAWAQDFFTYGNAVSRVNADGLREHVPLADVPATPLEWFIEHD